MGCLTWSLSPVEIVDSSLLNEGTSFEGDREGADTPNSNLGACSAHSHQSMRKGPTLSPLG